MACSYPVRIQNKKFGTGGQNRAKWNTQKYFYVPCGKCLQCMISKRRWLKKACEYEFNKYGCGAFVTLTYDNEHLLHLINEETQQAELDYRDFQLFMKRLRKNLWTKYKTNIDFKYVAVGEYGDQFGRPHMHLLIFGLDCRNNEYDIFKAWENGEVKTMPIKDGGINYVLKYMDKNENRKKNEYFAKDERKPYIRYSKGLGKGYIEENIDYIMKTDGMYKGYKNKPTSLPPYWINKLKIRQKTNFTEIREEMLQSGYRRRDGTQPKKLEEITANECRQWNFKKAQIKEQQLIRKSRDAGNAQEDFNSDYSNGIAKEMW